MLTILWLCFTGTVYFISVQQIVAILHKFKLYSGLLSELADLPLIFVISLMLSQCELSCSSSLIVVLAPSMRQAELFIARYFYSGVTRVVVVWRLTACLPARIVGDIIRASVVFLYRLSATSNHRHVVCTCRYNFRHMLWHSL